MYLVQNDTVPIDVEEVSNQRSEMLAVFACISGILFSKFVQRLRGRKSGQELMVRGETRILRPVLNPADMLAWN